MKMLIALPMATLLVLAGHPRIAAQSAEQSVRDRLAAMSLEQKVGQLMVPSFTPRLHSPESAHFKRLLTRVRKYHPGGVIFFRGEAKAIAKSVEALQQAAASPLLVMADMEWGAAMRVDGATRFLPNMAVGATRSEAFAAEIGRITALEARALGVHINFAPVLDVNNNPDNVIINTRSYGEDPGQVARLGAAFIRGLQQNGVYATAKHYPGHGDTAVDSHLALPVIHASRTRLEKVELLPFRAAVEAGVKCVMVGHITFSRVPEMEGRPASLDPYFLKRVLRKQMGFEGLVVTDAMNMGGVTRSFGASEAAIMAIDAGVDLVLMPTEFESTFDRVVAAVQEGRIPLARLDESVGRILAAKADLGRDRRPVLDAKKLQAVLAAPDHRARAEAIADAAMTLVRDRKNAIPLEAENLDRAFVVTLTDVAGRSARGIALTREVRRRVPETHAARIDPRTGPGDIEKIVTRAGKADAVIVGVFVRWRDRKGSISLPDATVKRLKNLFAVKKPLAVIAFGSPYVLRQIPEVRSFLCAYDTHDLAIRAATRAIFGEIPLRATLPVSIPGCARAGDGLKRRARRMELERRIDDRRLKAAYAVLEKAIADRVFPGAQVAVVQNGRLIASRGFGRQTYDASSPKVTRETLYDLASVTKVAATTTVAMSLWEQKKIELDRPVKDHFPRFSGGKKDGVTLRHLLTHSSGMHWWVDLWNKAKDKQSALEYVCRRPLDAAPGEKTVYSDLGLILVGEILETVTKTPLDRLARETIFAPMGMQNTLFNPPESERPRIAPTEIGGGLNRGLIHGEVHDENAHFLGGVAPHAGLFSTAEDLAALAQMLLNGGIYRHHRFFSPATVRYWTRRQGVPPGSDRALGWLTPSKTGSPAGDLFSPGSFGHTGFTGTSMWVDPDRKIAVILLTNRVHPTRKRGGMKPVRRAFHDAVMKALLSGALAGRDAPERKPKR